jgi:uncharacterized membrane protein
MEAAMMAYSAAYAGALAALVVADMIWLGSMVGRVYRPTLGDILLSGVNLPPAIVFYLLYPVGVLIFAVAPALKNGSATGAIMYGALFGFFAYTTYDLSNYATLRNWTLQLTIIDIAWGTLLGAMTAAAGFVLATKVEGMG